MKAVPRHSAPKMTREYNTVGAFMKVTTAPLHTLTPAKLDSIAASHAKRDTPAFHKLLAEVEAMIAARREREG